MSNTDPETIHINALRDASDPLKQYVTDADTAIVRLAVEIANPDLSPEKVEATVDSLTAGNLAMARVTGSTGAISIDRGVKVHVKVAPRPKADLPLGTKVIYRGGEQTGEIIAQHESLSEYTIKTANGGRYRSGAEFFAVAPE